MTPSRLLPLALLLLALPARSEDRSTFEGRFADAKARAKTAYLAPAPILAALNLRESSL